MIKYEKKEYKNKQCKSCNIFSYRGYCMVVPLKKPTSKACSKYVKRKK